ncbi:MAG: DUF4365 domain-containing protein [Thermoleophilaceae bacterium]|nr:DUF4365 domain-containing protein [Thermoleophilaceae bacterium]
MDLNSRKDHFSRAVVRAIAAAAGVGASIPELDQNSEDVHFAAPDTDTPGAKLDGQLKCSQNIDPSGDSFPYDLPVKNYDDLRWPADQLYVPRILIVVHVPEDPAEWLACDPDQIVVKRCAYWMSLAGAPETENTSTVRVNVPTEQVFDPDALLENLKPPGASL